VQQRLPSLLDPPITFAHRGARAHAPDNTLESFQLALRLGASGLESDVWLTADGIAVLDHDGVVGSRLRRRPISSVNRASLPEHIPTLAELFETCGSDFHLSLDLKDAAAARAVIDTARSLAPDALDRIWLCHPDLDLLRGLLDHVGPINLVESTRLSKIKEGPERHAATLAGTGLRGVNMHHTDWNGGLVALFHRFDLLAFSWDLQYEHVLRPALRMGIDAVYSDHTDVMVDAFIAEIGAG
jgi:glycerophosphoryl diester phosphodiesterase